MLLLICRAGPISVLKCSSSSKQRTTGKEPDANVKKASSDTIPQQCRSVQWTERRVPYRKHFNSVCLKIGDKFHGFNSFLTHYLQVQSA